MWEQMATLVFSQRRANDEGYRALPSSHPPQHHHPLPTSHPLLTFHPGGQSGYSAWHWSYEVLTGCPGVKARNKQNYDPFFEGLDAWKTDKK